MTPAAGDGLPRAAARGQSPSPLRQAQGRLRPLPSRERGGVRAPISIFPPNGGRGGSPLPVRPSGFRPRIEYGAGSSASSGQALRGNHPCRLRPAHQGMKMAPPPPVRVDDSNRGLDTGFRRYDDVGVSPLFWYQRRVSCGWVGVTREVSGRGVWSRLVRPRGPVRASAV